MSYFFNINEFKRWMKDHDDPDGTPKKTKFVGTSVESKYDFDRLAQYAESENDDLLDVLEEFVENGGTVVNVDGSWLSIQVESGGMFSIPKKHVNKS